MVGTFYRSSAPGAKPLAEVGQAVKAGDPLVSVEAMKMETQIRAEQDGVVKAAHVRPGDTVAARDLLVEMRS